MSIKTRNKWTYMKEEEWERRQAITEKMLKNCYLFLILYVEEYGSAFEFLQKPNAGHMVWVLLYVFGYCMC